MISKIILSLIILTSCVISIHADCGREKLKNTQKRRFNSRNESYPGQWPWHALLYKLVINEYKYICGSTIITQWHLLSAAHCIESNDAKIYNALMGAFNSSDSRETHQIRRNMSKIFKHDRYSGSDENLKSFNDIAILKMSVKVDYNERIQPICLPQSSLNLNNMIGYVTGYGATDSYGNIFRQKPSYGRLSSIENWKCMKNKTEIAKIISKTSFCVQNKNGLCTGDSGGGFYVHNKTSNHFLVYGIISHSSGRCSSQSYVAFVNVWEYIQWIDDRVNDECKNITCGKREVCKIDACICRSEFIGTSPNCTKECKFFFECEDDEDCHREKKVCSNPCPRVGSLCQTNSHCEAKNHQGVCTCDEGYSGNGFYGCKKVNIFGELTYQKDIIRCKSNCKIHLTFKITSTITINSAEINSTMINANESVTGILYENNHDHANYLLTNVGKFFPNVEFYGVFHQKVIEISRENFKDLTKIKKLKIMGNHIELQIARNSFEFLSELTVVSLTYSRIKLLPTNLFQNNLKLEIIELEYNKITSLDAIIFNKLSQLKELTLEGNQLISLPANIFNVLIKLEELNLSYNNLTSLDSQTFNKLPMLRHIHLNENKFESIDTRVFENNSKLTLIDLRDSHCINVTFGGQKSNKTLTQEERNSINCK